MINTLPDRLAFARSQKLDYAEFLELVLSDEAERRQQVSIQTRLNQAGFEEECTLERFDWSAAITLDKARLNELFGLHFIEAKQNVIFAGPVGVGKSFLACALGHSACRSGYRVLFSRADVMLKKLAQSRADNSFDRQLREYLTPDVLIIDDFALRRLSGVGSSDLYDLIIERHLRSSTIVTSNRDVTEWGGSSTNRCWRRAHWIVSVIAPIRSSSKANLTASGWRQERPAAAVQRKGARPNDLEP